MCRSSPAIHSCLGTQHNKITLLSSRTTMQTSLAWYCPFMLVHTHTDGQHTTQRNANNVPTRCGMRRVFCSILYSLQSTHPRKLLLPPTAYQLNLLLASLRTLGRRLLAPSPPAVAMQWVRSVSQLTAQSRPAAEGVRDHSTQRVPHMVQIQKSQRLQNHQESENNVFCDHVIIFLRLSGRRLSGTA